MIESPAAWSSDQWTDKLAATRAERLTQLRDELATRTTDAEAAQAHADEVTKPFYDRNRAELPGKVAAWAAGGAVVGGVTAGLFAGAPDGVGRFSGKRFTIAAAIGAAVLGTGIGALAHQLNGQMAVPGSFSAAARDAVDAASRARGMRDDAGLRAQIDYDANYRPGDLLERRNDPRLTMRLENVMANYASYDHDGDGAIDVRPGSAELRKDGHKGGPVNADSGYVSHLWPRGSADALEDGLLTVDEAAAAVNAEAEQDYRVATDKRAR